MYNLGLFRSFPVISLWTVLYLQIRTPVSFCSSSFSFSWFLIMLVCSQWSWSWLLILCCLNLILHCCTLQFALLNLLFPTVSQCKRFNCWNRQFISLDIRVTGTSLPSAGRTEKPTQMISEGKEKSEQTHRLNETAADLLWLGFNIHQSASTQLINSVSVMFSWIMTRVCSRLTTSLINPLCFLWLLHNKSPSVFVCLRCFNVVSISSNFHPAVTDWTVRMIFIKPVTNVSSGHRSSSDCSLKYSPLW